MTFHEINFTRRSVGKPAGGRELIRVEIPAFLSPRNLMLPREIHVQNWPDRTRYDLPVRPIGALRWIGLAPMAFAVLFAWAPARAILSSLLRMGEGQGSGFGWFFVLFLSVFVLAALLPFALGLCVLIGRARLIVLPDRFIATELAGPLRWSRIIRFHQIERLEFGPGEKTASQAPGILRGIAGITAIMKSGKKAPLVIGYPHDWLEPLLNELTNTLQLHGTVVPVKEARLESSEAHVTTEVRTEKPPDSNIELANPGWSVSLQVPSRGLWKESYGLLAFGIFWCLIVGVISTGFLIGSEHSGHRFMAAAFLGVFWIVGLALLGTGLHLGTRRWTLQADRSQLRVELKSLLRSRQWHWAGSDVEDVRVGDSGTRVNERMVEQLQVLSRTGRSKTGLLSGRTHEELAWVATTLRGVLGTRDAGENVAPPRKPTTQS